MRSSTILFGITALAVALQVGATALPVSAEPTTGLRLATTEKSSDSPSGGIPSSPTTTPPSPTTTPPTARKLSNPLCPEGQPDCASLPQLVGRAIQLMTGISGTLALLMFVAGGFLMLTSAGNPTRVEQGKKILMLSTLGLAIIFGAYVLVRTLFQVIGV